jgi:hypothetical protein
MRTLFHINLVRINLQWIKVANTQKKHNNQLISIICGNYLDESILEIEYHSRFALKTQTPRLLANLGVCVLLNPKQMGGIMRILLYDCYVY